MRSHTSLKRTYTLSFLIVASLPVLVFGLLSTNLVENNQLQGVSERNLTQAMSLAGEIESFLAEVLADLRLVEQTLTSEKTLQPGSQNAFLDGVVSNSQFFESIYLLDNHHKVVSLGVLPALQARRDDYTRLDFSGHQLFRHYAELDQAIWSDTFISLQTGEPSVTLGMNIAGGFLLGNIRLSSLSSLLTRYSAYGRVEVALLDKGGTLVAHNNPDMTRQRINFGDHPTVAQAIRGVASTEEFKQGPRYYLESAVKLPIPGWIVWVGLDMNEVQKPIQHMRNLLIGFMGIVVLMASTLALLNVRRLMQPLLVLGQRAELIADGHYDFDFKPSGFAEIDNLASQLSSMSHAIKVREEFIVANERRFRDLVNSVDGIVWEMEYPSFHFLFVSKQAESILGYPVQDWYERPGFWEEKTFSEDLEQTRSYCMLMAEKHQDHDFEYRMVAADGRMVWIRDLVTVVVENGRPVRLLGVMIDISQQKELLEELRHSEQNYREIFNSASDAIFIHDADSGQIVDVNRSMMKLYNCTYSEALASGIKGFSLGDAPYTVEEARLKLEEAQARGSVTFEWRSRKASGELFWSEVYLRSAEIGNKSRILAAVRDISDRKAAADELASYRLHLEELVTERTAQLQAAQAELVQKGRLAVLGQLTATVSHEIRNPLGTVANSLYLLKEALAGAEYAHLARPLELAERNVERCDNIISDLLDFSRQRNIEKKALDIDSWLAELLDELSFPAEIQCRRDLASQATVLADAERLRRVLVNVITNAKQALDEVAVVEKRIEVNSRVMNGRCEIWVSDNGPGMDETILSKIYEPMFSTKNFGVGLGVPIIKNIMESHGGGVEYQSEAGQGTTVRLWFPPGEVTSFAVLPGTMLGSPDNNLS